MTDQVTKETPTDFAKRIKMSKSYITKLKADDRLETEVKGKRWVVLVEASLAKMAATKDANRDDVAKRHAENRETGKKDVPASPAEDQAQLSYQQSRAKSEYFKAKSQEAEYLKMIGELVDVSVVKKASADLGTLLRTSLENLQDQMSDELAAETDPQRIYAMLGEHFETTLIEISRKSSQMMDAQA